jgi:hypothetical protein
MNSHFFRIAFVSMAAVTAIAPLTAQERGRGVLGPSQRSGRGVVVDDGSPRPQAFSVSLVLGDMQTASGPDNVPAAARKALTDVKDFLPYKAYRLLDSQWTLCCGLSRGDSRIVSRMRGPEDQDYSVELDPRNAGNGKWSVHFSLWEPRTIDRNSSSTAELEQQQADLEKQIEALRKTNTDNHPELVTLQMRLIAVRRELEAQRVGQRRSMVAPVPSRAVIDTSFTMDVGETVVVGTSRLKGDKALIALLTAVAPTKGTTK